MNQELLLSIVSDIESSALSGGSGSIGIDSIVEVCGIEINNWRWEYDAIRYMVEIRTRRKYCITCS